MFPRLLIVIGLVAALFVYNLFNQPERPTVNSSRWKKVTAEGLFINSWQGPWACVLDEETGLLWEVKTDDETVHDGYWTYSWFLNDVGVDNMGDCYFESERCDTTDLIRKVNQQKLCRQSNWRLPTAEELSSLLNDSQRPGDAKIEKEFFPYTKRGDYWSSDHEVALTGIYQHLKTGAVAVNFGSGDKVRLPYRNAAFVRLVAFSNSESQNP